MPQAPAPGLSAGWAGTGGVRPRERGGAMQPSTPLWTSDEEEEEEGEGGC